MVHALGFASVPIVAEDRPDRLLTGGMVRGDVKLVTGGVGLQTTELVDQGLTSCPREERVENLWM